MTTQLDLPPMQAQTVREILVARAPRPSRFWVFASRAKGLARRYSDLDLAVDAGRRLTVSEAASLEEEFAESALPWRVDLVDVQDTSGAFKALIFEHAILFATLEAS